MESRRPLRYKRCPILMLQPSSKRDLFLLLHCNSWHEIPMLALWSTEIARRGTWTCCSCSAFALGPQGLLAVPKTRKPTQIHQRKHSSSKASGTTKHDARALATATEAPAERSKCATPAESEKTSNSRSRKRRVKESLQEPATRSSETADLNLPSVPSTQRVHPLG